MKIYIAGPMTGLPGFNYAAFNEAEVKLRDSGHEVANPASNPAPEGGEWRDYMRQAVRQLVGCDAVAVLPDWHTSRGANIEVRLAVDLDLPVASVAAYQRKLET